MSPRVETASFFLLVGACVFVGIAAIVLLSRLNNERLGALENLRALMVKHSTKVIGAIGVGNEIWQSYKYGAAFNWTGILLLLGITAATTQVQSGQKSAATATQSIVETTDVILNTMPVKGSTVVTPGSVPVPPAPAPKPPLIPVKDSS